MVIPPTKENLLQLHGDFTWFWGRDWFIETVLGNFHWKDPQYDGDNTMTWFSGTYREFCRQLNIDEGRGKGFKDIKRTCGDQFTLLVPEEVMIKRSVSH